MKSRSQGLHKAPPKLHSCKEFLSTRLRRELDRRGSASQAFWAFASLRGGHSKWAPISLLAHVLVFTGLLLCLPQKVLRGYLFRTTSNCSCEPFEHPWVPVTAQYRRVQTNRTGYPARGLDQCNMTVLTVSSSTSLIRSRHAKVSCWTLQNQGKRISVVQELPVSDLDAVKLVLTELKCCECGSEESLMATSALELLHNDWQHFAKLVDASKDVIVACRETETVAAAILGASKTESAVLPTTFTADISKHQLSARMRCSSIPHMFSPWAKMLGSWQ